MPDGSKRTGAGWKGRGADHTRGGQPGFGAAAIADFMLIGRQSAAAGSKTKGSIGVGEAKVPKSPRQRR